MSKKNNIKQYFSSNINNNILLKVFKNFIVPINNLNNEIYKNHHTKDILKKENIKNLIQENKNKFNFFLINAEIKTHYELQNNINGINKFDRFLQNYYYKNSIDKIIYIYTDDLSELEIKTIADLCFLNKDIIEKSLILMGRKRFEKIIINNLSAIFTSLIATVDNQGNSLFKGTAYFINKTLNNEYEFLLATNIRKVNGEYEQINLPHQYELKIKFDFNSISLNKIESITPHPIIGNINANCKRKEIFPNFLILDKKLVNNYYEFYEDYYSFKGIFTTSYLKEKILNLNKGLFLTLYPGIESLFKEQSFVENLNRMDFLLLELYGSGNSSMELIKYLNQVSHPTAKAGGFLFHSAVSS